MKGFNKKGEQKVTMVDVTKIEQKALSIRDLMAELLLQARKTNFYLSILAGREVSDDDARRL